jgi:hypothetical protein
MTVHDFIPFIAKLFLTICNNLSLHYDFALHSGEVNTYSKSLLSSTYREWGLPSYMNQLDAREELLLHGSLFR